MSKVAGCYQMHFLIGLPAGLTVNRQLISTDIVFCWLAQAKVLLIRHVVVTDWLLKKNPQI